MLLVLAFGAAFVVLRWRYETIISSLEARLDTQRDRMQAKDEQISEYRERLHLVPTDATAYSRLTNGEVQERALKVVADLRQFLKERGERERDSLLSGWRRDFRQMSDVERQRAWEAETNALMQDSLETSTHYDERFKVDTILLRDELLARLPQGAKNEQAYRTYEHPTNPIGMGIVADDLERLAKNLTVKVSP
jgi:hypothetical protein